MGWLAVKAALLEELKHLLSDVQTAKSLPLPIVSWISPYLSHFLNDCGVDSLFLVATGAEATFASLINNMIGWIYQWCNKEGFEKQREIYEAKARKVVSLSNEIATASSTAETVVRMLMGDSTATVGSTSAARWSP